MKMRFCPEVLVMPTTLPAETMPLNNETFYDDEKKACCE
jgi:hypothetical protein